MYRVDCNVFGEQGILLGSCKTVCVASSVGLVVLMLRMYFSRNWKFGLSLSKLRNFAREEFEHHPPPHKTSPSVRRCVLPTFSVPVKMYSYTNV
jgi:hypothetical protein